MMSMTDVTAGRVASTYSRINEQINKTGQDAEVKSQLHVKTADPGERVLLKDRYSAKGN